MKARRIAAGILSLVMLAGLFPASAMAAREEETPETPLGTEATVQLQNAPRTGGERLINVADQAEITAPQAQSGRPTSNMVDGDLSTMWVKDNGGFPCDVVFAFSRNLTVKRIELDFERSTEYPNRAVTVKLAKNQNGITADPETIREPVQHKLGETLVYENTDGTTLDRLEITLSEPKADYDTGAQGLFWPAIAEVRIYAAFQIPDLADFDDITSHAEASAGANYKLWDFKSNQQVVGFKATLAEGANAVLKGKQKRGSTWTTYVSPLQSGENVLDFATGMSAVRVELSDPTQLTAFQIFGTYTEPVSDPDNPAFDKSTHSNFNDSSSYLVVDGSAETGWQAELYPAYVDIDLEKNYDITEIQVVTPAAGYTEYTLYTSMDGQNYDLVASKLDDAPCTGEQGDVHPLAAAKTARYVRVYLEYYSANAKPTLNEVRVTGTESADQTDHTVTFSDVTAFEDSDYAAPITQQDTIEEVKGIIRRQVGAAYVNWFTFALADDPDGYDYFTLEDAGGKIKVTGNSGVSLATGVNHYLKYFCNAHISQVGNQVNMPSAVVPVGTAVHKETKYHTRYAYNYCTHSYSMAFWGADEWRNELDWLALNGVNLVLDITGQEEVWREFLMDVGFTHQEAKDFLAGPGYYAWAYMANLTGFGGPIHDSYLTNQVEQGRKNQRTMRVLGMEPVLQAFSGMVPVEITTKDPDAAVIPQGAWCSFQRPTMLKTDTATYDEYAAKFYAAQKRVFGDAKYYATDPFHEGGNTGGMSTTVVASELLDSLLAADPDAVWVIQSWQGNPSSGLLAGLRAGTNPTRTDRRDHALVLDLYAERTPHNNEYGEDTDGDGIKEFSDTPWVWCQLNNFGGRMGLHGYLDNLQKNIPATANRSRHMAGIGISPEGSQENPVLYDFLFETIWTEDASQPLGVIDLDQWLKDYVTRRYGASSENAQAAMAILAETVYNSTKTNVKQGAPESVVNARPAKSIDAASTWGYSNIYYDKTKLQEAAKLLLKDYATLSASDAYLYDLADVLKQVLSNTAQYIHGKMIEAYNNRDVDEFTALSDQFLALIDLADQVMSTRKEFLFGTWTTNASELAADADDFTQRLYLRNAKALVTTWGAIQQCNTGGLKDYSNRQWSGLTKDFYKARWTKWIDQAKTNLAAGNSNNISIDWFPWEWEFARDPASYSNQPSGLSLKTLGQQVLKGFSIVTPPEATDLYDIDIVAVKAGSQHVGSDENDACENVLDNNTGTIWHTEWNGTVADADKWIAFDLGEVAAIAGLRYLPRQNQASGRITEYAIYVSKEASDWAGSTDTWQEITTGTWDTSANWKKAEFAETEARYVKLVALNGPSAQGGTNKYYSAAEIRITEPIPEEFSITYDLAGGIVSEENPDSYNVKTPSFTLENPTRIGYIFAGWTGTDLSEPTMTVTIAQGSTGDRAYTATWMEESKPKPPVPVTPVLPDPDATTEVNERGEKVTTVTDPETRATTVTVSAPDGSQAEIVTKEGKTAVEVTLTQKAVEEGQEGGVTLPVVGLDAQKKPEVKVTLPEGAQGAVVRVPMDSVTPGTVAIQLLPDGTEKIITASVVEDGAVLLPLDASGSIRLEDKTREFNDVAGDDWFADSVAYVSSRELFRGTGQKTFAPKENLSRGMLATVLYRYAGEPDAGQMSFDDLEDGLYYSDAVRWAAEQKVVTGVGGGRFDPERSITREELAVMLYRFAGSPETEANDLSGFGDGAAVSSWAEKAVRWAVEQGILRGTTGGKLMPGATANRAEAAAMLLRFARSSL